MSATNLPGLARPSISQAQPAAAPKRSVAEVCMELLLLESVRLLASNQMGPSAAAAAEAIGIRVGKQLAERYTKDKPRLGDTLEVIKFLCKDFWIAVFKKQVDNLRTNHRGVYVLFDNDFRWLARLPTLASAGGDPDREQEVRAAAMAHLYLPCGIIRGALTQLGIMCVVEADPKAAPACSFTIKISS